MPDGSRYEDDFFAWTQHQATVLRSLPIADNRFDREHVAEEIEDLGKSERDAVRSQILRILEHLLKLAHSPAEFRGSTAEARSILGDKMSPTLRRDAEAELEHLYRSGRRQAELALRGYAENAAADLLPAQCPYSLDDICREDWYPESPPPSRGWPTDPRAGILASMPDGPRYDDDFYAWTQHQAAVLRSLPIADNRFDREHVAEEIEDLGKSERNAVRSQIRRIIEHLLKLGHSPSVQPRFGWTDTVRDARQELSDRITPTLRRDAETSLCSLYADARKRAEASLREFGEPAAADALPAICPYSLDDICREDWYPARPGGRP